MYTVIVKVMSVDNSMSIVCKTQYKAMTEVVQKVGRGGCWTCPMSWT